MEEKQVLVYATSEFVYCQQNEEFLVNKSPENAPISPLLHLKFIEVPSRSNKSP